MFFINLNQETEISLDKIDFDKSSNLFKLSSVTDADKYITINYTLPIYDDYSINDFDAYILYSNDMSENRIYQVYEKSINKRIGWIFPINALISNLHTYANDEHFLKYAFVAIQLLALNANIKIDLVAGENYNITDRNINKALYDDNIIIFIVEKSMVVDISFDLKNYLPSFYLYNYFYKESNIYNKINLFSPIKRISIKRTSKELLPEKYIHELFTELIFEKHSLIKFYLLYQIIEMLIERILNIEVSILSKKLKEKEIFTRELKDKISLFESEDKRISKLFSEYAKKGNKIIRREFVSKCDLFLRNMNRYNNDINNIEKKLYSIRNFIVHDYRSIPISKISSLNDVISSFEYLCVDLILNYKENI